MQEVKDLIGRLYWYVSANDFGVLTQEEEFKIRLIAKSCTSSLNEAIDNEAIRGRTNADK